MFFQLIVYLLFFSRNSLKSFNNFKISPNSYNTDFGFYSQSLNTEQLITQQGWNTVQQDNPINYSFNFVAGNKCPQKWSGGRHSAGVLLLWRQEHLCAGFYSCAGRECCGTHVSTTLRCPVCSQGHELVRLG